MIHISVFVKLKKENRKWLAKCYLAIVAKLLKTI